MVIKYIDINKYIDDNTIVFNCLETWCGEFKDMPQKIINNKIEIQDFVYCLEKSNVDVLCYHATRLTNEEIDNIKENGMLLPNKDTLYRKINNNKYLIPEEKEILVNNLRLENNRVNMQFFFTEHKGKTIYDNNDVSEPLNNYGGEIICNNKTREIIDKMDKYSYPCIIVAKVKCKDILPYNFYQIIENIFKNIDNNLSEIALGISTRVSAKVLDVIKISKETIIVK